MAYTITPVDTANDTFQIWVDRTNETINAISNFVLTTNTHANGALTTGNGFVEGTFGVRNLTANTLRGGTVQTPNTLYITSNVDVNSSYVWVLGDIVINSTAITSNGDLVGGGIPLQSDIDGTSITLLDAVDKINKRSSEYFVAIADRNANAYHAQKVLVLHNSGNVFMTEYAILYTNTSANSLGAFSANANSTHYRLYVTPTVANTRITGTRFDVIV